MVILTGLHCTYLIICRREKRRDGCCCCFRLSDGYSESDCGKRDLLQKLMDKYFGRALLTLPGKVKLRAEILISKISELLVFSSYIGLNTGDSSEYLASTF